MIDSIMQNDTVMNVLAIAGALWTLLSTIALITPSDKDNTWLEKIGKFADKAGLNLKGK
jgi:hypothetical protein